jgi:hypothetical protein
MAGAVTGMHVPAHSNRYRLTQSVRVTGTATRLLKACSVPARVILRRNAAALTA